jgi:hypothetical protein
MKYCHYLLSVYDTGEYLYPNNNNINYRDNKPDRQNASF